MINLNNKLKINNKKMNHKSIINKIYLKMNKNYRINHKLVKINKIMIN